MMETRSVGRVGCGALRRFSAAACAAVLFAAATALADGDTSDPALVYLRPETSSFWHTATNSTMTLPVEFPIGASSATLTITGAFGYSQTISDITTSSVTVVLPEATMGDKALATEDVYDFTLAFDDGTIRTGRLGLISGLGDGRGSTRCLAPASGRAWEKVRGHVAIPIPYGMTSFEIDGVSTDPGLGGAQGWYAFKLDPDVAASLSALVGEDAWSATLKGGGIGCLVIVW